MLLASAVTAHAQDVEGVQSSGAVLVAPPPPIPPPALLSDDVRVRRARALLTRVEVFDTASARLARQLARLPAEGECAAAKALARSLDLVVQASSDALDTAGSGLDVLPDRAEVALLRDRVAQAEARRVDARAALGARVTPLAARCSPEPVPPTPWIPPEERGVLEARAVLFVRADAGQVVWVGGHPAGAPDAQGWSAVVASSGDVTLCVADAIAEGCVGGVLVEARPFAAFDLATD